MQAYSLGVMAHVLRAVKGFEGQAIEEVPWVQQPRHWPYLPPSVLPAGVADVRSLVCIVSNICAWHMAGGRRPGHRLYLLFGELPCRCQSAS